MYTDLLCCYAFTAVQLIFILISIYGFIYGETSSLAKPYDPDRIFEFIHIETILVLINILIYFLLLLIKITYIEQFVYQNAQIRIRDY